MHRRERWRVSARDFESLVEEALEAIPDRFKKLLDNVVVLVEEEPEEDDFDATDEDSELLGIFRGSPMSERSFGVVGELPSQIAIFRGPILRICRSREEAIEEIRDTVVHELGHYFGLEDEEMEY